MKSTESQLRSWIEWLYRLLRPQGHARIALAVIALGGALLVSPIWEPLLRGAAKKYFDVDIDPPASPFFGLVLIVLALVYHFLSMKLEKEGVQADRQNKIEQERKARGHDLEIANRIRELFPEPRQTSFFNRMINEHACRNSETTALGSVINYIDSAEAHFLNSDLRSAASAFADAGAALQKFIGLRFFVYPKHDRSEDRQFAMQPSWNVDREGKGTPEQEERYDKLTAEMEGLLRTMDDAYISMIKKFHEELLV